MLLIVRGGNYLKPGDLVLAIKEILNYVSIGAINTDVTLVTDGSMDDDATLLDAYRIVSEIILTTYELISDIRVLIDASDGLIVRINMHMTESYMDTDEFSIISDKLKSVGNAGYLFDSYYVEDEGQGNVSVSISYNSSYDNRLPQSEEEVSG